MAQQQQLMAKQSANADQVIGIAKPLLQQSSDLIQTPINYYSAIASGDRNAALGALSPEIADIKQGYQAAQGNQMTFGPRGGGRNSQLQNLGFAQTGDINRLLATARPQAIQALTGISGQIGSQGSALFGQGSNIYQGNIGDLTSIDQQLQANRLATMGMIGQIGGAVGGALFGHFFPPKGCWVAAEIFGGWFAPKTCMARFYINSIGPRWFRALYLRHGESFATKIKGRRFIKLLIRPLFEYFAWRGAR